MSQNEQRKLRPRAESAVAAMKTVVWRNAFVSDIRRVLPINIRTCSESEIVKYRLQSMLDLNGGSQKG